MARLARGARKFPSGGLYRKPNREAIREPIREPKRTESWILAGPHPGAHATPTDVARHAEPPGPTPNPQPAHPPAHSVFGERLVRRMDHILIYSPMGLGPGAQHAVRTLERTWTKGGVGELRVAIAGQGDVDDLRRLPPSLPTGVTKLLGGEVGARVWESLTPLVLPRYRKPRGANTLEGQVLAELVSRGLPSAGIQVLPWDDQTRQMRHTVRVRRYPAKPPPVDAGFAVRLLFDRSVKGPIAPGYGCHFGLGVFGAVEDPITANQPVP